MTLNDISKKAGVSVATVCRVSKNFPGVKASTRKKVLSILRAAGYHADSLPGQELFSAKKSIEILICPLREQHEPIALSYYTTVLEGIRSVLTPDNFDLKININFLVESGTRKHFRANSDGIILVGFPEVSLIDQLENGSIPYVIQSNNPASNWTELVSVDKYQESFQLVEKLAGEGIRRFGLLIPKIDYNVLNGLVSGLRFLGLELEESNVAISDDTDLPSFIVPIQKLLETPVLPEAMICINNAVLQLYQEMLKRHRPGENERMRYVFFSDCPDKYSCKAIRIQTDSFQEGVLSAEWLMNKIKSNRVKDNYRISVPMNYVFQD
ncbi:hypothetical protein SDC9_113963 [bioreactor metagenome]|uniref:HTH lacI-type domain-containing protein n=1 Tax=bioreactor metagenome TaxID=1076179 RepID=A0A645BP77_9ZZZZ